jgi:hypothetical protein
MQLGWQTGRDPLRTTPEHRACTLWHPLGIAVLSLISSACAGLLFLPVVANGLTTRADLTFAVAAPADALRDAVVAAIPARWETDEVSAPTVSRLGAHGWQIVITWIEHDDEWIFPSSAMPWQISFRVLPLDAARSCLLVVAENHVRLEESGLGIARAALEGVEARLAYGASTERDCAVVLQQERERRLRGLPPF